MDNDFFENSELYKRCAESQDLLLKNLAFKLGEAWGELINKNEAESLMSDVKDLIDEFERSDEYPPFDEVQCELLESYGDRFRVAVKWASVYAGLAGKVERKPDIAGAWKLTSYAVIILFQCYPPQGVEAQKNYVSRKGGEGRSMQWGRVKEELRKLIEREFSAGRQPFNSKVEAAEFFAKEINDTVHKLRIKNMKTAMSKTIQNWFTEDDLLKVLIKKLISPTPTRRRSRQGATENPT